MLMNPLKGTGNLQSGYALLPVAGSLLIFLLHRHLAIVPKGGQDDRAPYEAINLDEPVQHTFSSEMPAATAVRT